MSIENDGVNGSDSFSVHGGGDWISENTGTGMQII